jgi:4'-phosphopantetheinyl transferase
MRSAPEICFSALERAEVDRVPESERQRLLAAHWVLKEAYVKAVGTGLRLRPAEVSFDLRPDLSVRSAVLPQGHSVNWQFRVFHPTPVHLAALCAGGVAGTPFQVVRRALAPTIRGDEVCLMADFCP